MTASYPGIDLPQRSTAQTWPSLPAPPPTRPAPIETALLPTPDPKASREHVPPDALKAVAARSEMEVRQAAYEGVEQAVRASRESLRPQLAELRRMRERPEPERTGDDRARTLDREEDVAREMRVAASRLYAIRLSIMEQTMRTTQDVDRHAAELAETNRRIRQGGRDEAATEKLVARQQLLTATLSSATGAVATREKDGTVTLRLGDRALVEGDRSTPLTLTRGSAPADEASAPDPEDGTQAAPARPRPDAPPAATPRPDAPPPLPDAPETEDAPKTPTPTPGRVPPVTDPSVPAADPLGPTPAAPAEPARLTWPDGEDVAIAGTLRGQLVAAEATVDTVLHRLDALASAIVAQSSAAQASGLTAAGTPGTPLLRGTVAWDLAVVAGTVPADVALPAGSAAPGPPTAVDEAAGPTVPDAARLAFVDVAVMNPSLMDPAGLGAAESVAAGLAGAPAAGAAASLLPPVVAGPQLGGATAGLAPGVLGASLPGVAATPGSQTPEEMLDTLEADLTKLTQHASRRSAVAAEVESLLSGPGRVGITVQTALGAVASGSSVGPVEKLQMLNAAMLSVGSVAGSLGSGTAVPVLVGSSDPTVATASGAVSRHTPASAFGQVATVTVEQVATGGSFVSAVLPTGPVSPAPFTLTVGDGARDPVAVPVPAGAEAAEIASLIAGGQPGLSAAVEPAADGVVLRITGDVGRSPQIGPADAPVSGTAVPAVPSQLRLGDTSVLTSPSGTVAGVWPGVDVTVKVVSAQPVRLALTPDPSPALDKMQGFLAAANGALGVAASAPSAVSAAVAGSLVGVVVDAEGRPLVPGLTRVHDGRLSFDREAFGRAYVRDAPATEEAMATLSRAVGEVVEKSSDPRTGVLPIRIHGDLAPQSEYSVGDAGIDERLAYRQEQLAGKVDALRALLVRLGDQEEFLTHALPGR